MSIASQPQTVKELKQALSKLPERDKVQVFEADDIIKRMPSASTLKAQGRTVIVI